MPSNGPLRHIDKNRGIKEDEAVSVETFISVGENIHCTRIYKVGGLYVAATETGHAVRYKDGDTACELPVPDHFTQSADWENGKVKHCAVAMWQGLYGDEAARQAGIHYLQCLARRQEAAGATYLDINVDEFSTDVEERVNLMRWAIDIVQQAVAIPVSVDSSNIQILQAGLESCDAGRKRPMVNSVSLERADAVDVAVAAKAVVIASAAGEKDLPNAVEDRMANINAIMQRLRDAGMPLADIHVDPLVFPISTDGQNGVRFLDTVAAVRAQYGPEIHIVAGLSNVSFGMPERKLINQVFTSLALQRGADGGIVDPIQINKDVLNAIDENEERFQLARALLLGEDDFGMNFIMASREGKL